MVKNWICILFILIITSCDNSPEEIPEDKLRDMIADIVLVDSYVANIIKPTRRDRDTIDYFNPILDKYGYTIEDLEYTINKYARRKTDIIWNSLDKATARVEVIKNMYDNNKRLREKLNIIISERSTDTLYYSNDTINIRNAENLKKLIKKYPIKRRGEFTIKYDYKVGEGDKNESRYFVYFMKDTLDKSVEPYRNSFWIASTSSSDKKRSTNRVIKTMNIRIYNSIEIIPFDYTNQSNNSKKGYKNMSTKIWDLLITFTPDPRDVINDVLLEDNPYPFMIDIKSQYEDRFENSLLTPYSLNTLGIIQDTIAIDSL